MVTAASNNPDEVLTTIPPRLDRLPWSHWHLRMAFALGITFLLDGLEGGVGGSLAGALKSPQALHFTDAQLGLASTGYLFGTVLGAFGFGYLADRFGRKSLFTWTLVFYVCATALTALSWNLPTFLICRMMTGAGIGGEYTAINSAIDELIPARVRGRVNLFIGSSFWIGVILGSLVAVGFLSDSAFGLRLGWRFAFLSGLPIAAVVLYLRRHIPESPRWLLTHSRDAEAAEVITGIEREVAAQFGELPKVTNTVAVLRRTKDPIRSLSVLWQARYRGRAALCMVLVMAQSFFYNSVFFSAALILLRFYGLNAAHAGVLFLPLALTNFIGPIVLGRLVDTVGRRTMIAINFFLAGTALIVSNLLFLRAGIGIVGQVTWWSIAFFFAANAAGSAYLTTSELFPQQIRATAIAVFYGFGTLFAGVLGPAVFGALLNRGNRQPIFYGFMVSASVMLIAAVVQAIWGVAAEGKPLKMLFDHKKIRCRKIGNIYVLPHCTSACLQDIVSEPAWRRIKQQEIRTMIPAYGYASNHSFTGLKPHKFEREDARPNEVVIEVLFCGVCHSDIHQVKKEWGNTVYPCMPGHEIVGRVTSKGSEVTRHQIGDLVGVGCMIDSCRSCEPCRSGDQNYCEGPNSWLATYNGPMVPAKKAPDEQNHYGRENTFGGYSNVVVVPEDFVLKTPAGLDPKVAAPILCAGVTTYSPMKHWKVKAGDNVGIVGFGGLGDIAARMAIAMGATVTLFTTAEEKQDEARRIGATAVMEDELKKEVDPANPLTRSFDFILSTVPEKHDLNPYLPLLKRDATMVICGDLGPLEPINNMQTASHRNSVAGSLIGSIAETQEVLDFCAEHGVAPDVQVIDIKDINDAYKDVEKGKVRFRYVIDMATLKAEEPD